ncbi:MAG TPA: hypothetical protein ENJ89_01275 [Caldithrix abyssi]|uniref:Uncharacterized protein n=1 Tax=Caldithrix abyssi TaxID=187145 RepID=A0A7V5PMG4_CALAY|nr:hypothetical protein [Caldithrix abyssi]
MPNFSTIWRFRERLIKTDILDTLFGHAGRRRTYFAERYFDRSDDSASNPQAQ